MRRRRKSAARALRVLAYVRVSTDEQRDSGLGIEAQREALRRAAEERGWQDVRYIEDAGASGSTLDRPGLQEALGLLEDGEADVLAVAKLDRLTRSLRHYGELSGKAEDQCWQLAIIDLGLGFEMSSPESQLVANLLASVAQYERAVISKRTSVALRAKAARGEAIGNPRWSEQTIPDDVRDLIRSLRDEGLSYPKIAARLTEDGIPTARGGKWFPSTVRSVVVGDT